MREEDYREIKKEPAGVHSVYLSKRPTGGSHRAERGNARSAAADQYTLQPQPSKNPADGDAAGRHW